MPEWLIAIGVFAVLVFVLVARMLPRTKAVSRKGSGSGVVVGIGLAFAMVFDPKVAQAMEIVDQKQDECEDDESGDRP